MNDEGKKQTRGFSLATLGASIAAAIAGTAALLSNLEGIRKTWCDHVGLGCTFIIESQTVHVESGGTKDNKSDVCKEHVQPVCVAPTSLKRQLDHDNGKFKITVASGANLLDGGPPGDDPVGTHNIGWFVTQSGPKVFCVKVFARTSACETKVFIEGSLVAKELVPAIP